MIYWLPLEPLAQRYTEQMHRWVVSALERCGHPWKTVLGKTAVERITHGQWLDTTATCAWKTEQVLQMTEAIAAGELQSGDTILVGDVWFPGIETLKFQCDLLGLQVKFAGWHYAGCFDPHDYLAKTLGPWGKKYEAALLEGVFDHVCFGSPFHQGFVERSVTLKGRGCVAGLAWDHDEVAAHRSSERSKVVVFNHRWADEKRWQEFVWLANFLRNKFPQWRFAYSTSGTVAAATASECNANGIDIVCHDSKTAYYNWLARAGVVWSGADQETFGYSFMEAIALGVPVVAPNRLAYRDHFLRAGLSPENWLYGASDPCGMSLLSAEMTMGSAGIKSELPAIISKQYHDSAYRFVQEVADAD